MKGKIMEFLIKIVLMLSFSSVLMMAMSTKESKIGLPAPDVTAIDQDSVEVNFSEIYKTGLVLVYFYPKADTPGCTAQACSLRDAFADLQQDGLTIFGVSSDGAESQKKFKDKYNLPFRLIADKDKKVIKAFDVPSMMGFAKRQAFLIKDGTIIWHDGSASTDKQAEDVQKQIELLKNK